MDFLRTNALRFALVIAILATFGSLYFQYVLDFPPCVLCWFQRIFMYPLVFIIGLAIKWHHDRIREYVLPFTVIGGGIAVYHNLLYYNIIPEAAAPCQAGISCTTKFVEYGGFITIPLLSLAAFVAITVLVLIYRRQPPATS
jgi:disulfide bond formation protein DsbB